MIDAHHHYWEIARGDYSWMHGNAAVAAINRDYLPPDLDDQMRACGVTHTVLVQAAPTVAETEFLLTLAEQTPHIAKVVGWIDFENPESISDLERLSEHAAFAGVRPMIQDIEDPEWMHKDSVQWAYAAMVERGLVFDALGTPIHLDAFNRLFQRYSDLQIVIDHGMKPYIARRKFGDWAVGMAEIAQTTNVCCKVSGLLTESRDGDGVDELRPYVQHLFDVFGTERLMWGSDWPVLDLVSEYVSWHRMAMELIPASSHQAVFTDNAARFYKIDV